MLILSGAARGQATPATAPATTPARPDPNVWARRNVELIRAVAARAAQPAQKDDRGFTLVQFSITFNRILIREPYAGELHRFAADARAAAGDRATFELWDRVVRFLELPEDERRLRLMHANSMELDKPLVTGHAVYSLATTLEHVPPGEMYEQYVPKVVERMDDAARQAGNWDGLALAYATLARDALERGRRDRANLYADRLVSILRAHPQFQDPARGNTDGVDPATAADLLLGLDRRRDLERLIDGHAGEVKADLIAGLVSALASRDRLDEARAVAERQLRPVAPRAADRIVSALNGQVLHPPTQPASRPKAGRLRPPATEMRLRAVEVSIARAHARRGELETASRMLIALQADRPHHPAGAANLAAHEWARLADLARRGGHLEAARRALERAIESEAEHEVGPRERIEEKVRFVREALRIDQFELASFMLNTSSPPGAGGRYRLGKAYLARGDERRARALFDEAIEIGQRDRGGSAMAAVAVELHRLGDVKRAEEILLASLDHIEGVDFGLGGSADVVYAAAQMNRLDLLDRLYEQSDADARMLLCIAACNFGLTEHDRHLD